MYIITFTCLSMVSRTTLFNNSSIWTRDLAYIQNRVQHHIDAMNDPTLDSNVRRAKRHIMAVQYCLEIMIAILHEDVPS